MLHRTIGFQSADDPLEYIMSDETVDRYGDVIAVAGWKLAAFKNNPIALFGHDSEKPIGTWENVRIEKGKLIGRLKFASAEVSERIREIRGLVEERVLRAVSVGFRPLKREPLEGGGPYSERYTESELVECSLVSVPANPNALQIVKALNIPASRAALYLGKPAIEDQIAARSASPGKPARAHLPPGGRAMRVPIAKQIEDAEATRNRLQDQMNDITENTERSAEDETLLQNLTLEVEDLHQRIQTLKGVERAMGLRATGGEGEGEGGTQQRAINGEITPPSAKRPFAVPAKKVTPKDLIIRGLAIQFMSHIHKANPLDMTKRMYGDDESTMWLMRAVTNPAMTTVPGWAMELVQTGVAEFLDQLPIDSIYGPLSSLGVRFTFGRNGVIKVPGRAATPTLAGSFVGEGQPIPVRRLGLTSVTLTPKKLGVISTFTRELSEHSTPSIEAVIRQAMAEDTAVAIDNVLLDSNPATTIRPAGLLNGVTPITANDETDPLAMVADLKALVTAITTNRGGRSIAILVNPAQAIGIAFQQSTTGEFLFPTTEAAGNRLGVTFISSANVPVDTVIAIDAADFASATGDVPNYNVSDQATIHEEDTAPLPLATGAQGSGVVATPTRSLWQTDTIGVRMTMDVNWAMRRPGMVQYMVGVSW